MSVEFQRVCVVGLGYIGLPTAAIFASRKRTVIGVDINERAVDTINRGQIHIVEPDLDIVVHAAVTEGYLRATTKPEPADAFLLAVPTPFKGAHEPDLSFVEAATRAIAPHLRKGNLVVLESTSPVGTTEQVATWIAELRTDLRMPTSGTEGDVCVAHCPERVLPGKVMAELINNDRVIGGITKACAERAVSLYAAFVKGKCFVTDARTAEMCKLAENAFRDVNIAFANELSLICEKLNINVWELIRLANRHPRVNILRPGPGVGGHCIAVDPWFIVHAAPDESTLLATARRVNDGKPDFVVRRVLDAMRKTGLSRVTCLGLAFKPDIDDLRESPAVEIVAHLASVPGVTIGAVEPHITDLPLALRRPNVSLTSVDSALSTESIVVTLVKHSMFSSVVARLKSMPNVIDTVGLLEA